MFKEDLFFKKVEGGVNKDMHGCAYENCDCTCKLTETYGTCIYKSNVGKCTYVPFEAENPYTPSIIDENLHLYKEENCKILKMHFN